MGSMRSCSVRLILFSLLLFPGLLVSEPTSLSGRVIDATTKRPIANANVFLRGTPWGDATDPEGRFLIQDVPEGEYRILVSHIGYTERGKTISLPQTDILTLELHEAFFQLEQVVVTGTRTEKIHKDVPIATEVISRKDIVDSGARDLAELLDERAGTYIHSSVAGGNILNLLGIDSKYILVLIDGQPVTGKFNDRISLDQISATIAEKVEIVKGPSSSLYGSEAMGGVINIITRRELVPSAPTVRVRFTGSDNAYNIADGDQGKRDIRFNGSKKWEKIRFSVDLDLLKANVDQANQYISVDEFDNLTFNGDVRWTPLGYHTLDIALNAFSKGEQSHTRILDAKTAINRSSLVLQHSWRSNSGWRFDTMLRGDAYGRQHTQRRAWGELFDRNNSQENQLEFEHSVFMENVKNTLNLGIEVNRARFSSERVKGGHQQLVTSGVYFQWERIISPSLHAIIGSRLDANDEVRSVISPRLALMYTFRERWKFRSAWGTGFRLPSFMDRYIDWDHVQFGYRITGNPELSPEFSDGYSLGVEYYHPGRYQVSFMVYRNRFRDMIVDHLLEPGSFSYKNIDRVQYTGVELLNRWSISSNWLASWGYNYLDNRDLTTGRLIPNTQPHSASLRISYKSSNGKFSGAAKAKVVGAYYPEEYVPELGKYIRSDTKRATFALINVTGKAKLSRLFDVAVGVQNVSDYKDPTYGPFIGRTFYVELISELGGGK